MAAKAAPKTLVEAVQAVFDALEPFDEAARHRILQSATSLLGGSLTAPVLGSSSPSHSPSTLPKPVASERPVSPVELVHEKNPATNPQRIALFAYYREKSEGLSRFAKDDLKPYFAKAKQPPPQNYDRDFGQAVKLGWIYEDDSDSYLTSKGLEAVEAGFDGRGTSRKAKVRKKVAKKAKRPKR